MSPRSTRRIARSTGLEVVRAWGHGGYWFEFVVADPTREDGHRHGEWNKVSGEWRMLLEPGHFTTCRELFRTVSTG